MLKPRKIERVMLIFPPVRIAALYDKMACVPMGISYLGAVLRSQYEVKLLDAIVEGHDQERWETSYYFEYGLSLDQIVKEVEKFSPQVVGITCLFSAQFITVARLAKKIKEQFPEIITVTGGTHPSFLPEDSLTRAPDLDYIVIGEAEESFPQLLQALSKGTGLESIDGLAWRDNGSIRINPKARYIQDLDTIPFPARDLLPIEKYFKINTPFMFFSKSPRNISFITSRGCPFRCRFCSSCHYWGKGQRFRSIENVLAEMEELKNRFGVEELKFEDDNLLANTRRAKELFRAMIERKFNFHWNMPNGALVKALDDDELLDLMKESGCYEVILAFESGDQEVVDKIIKKPLDLEKGKEIAKKVKAHGIDTHAFFIIGFPGETKAQIMNTLNYAKSIALDKIYIFLFNPLPGTGLYEEAIARGLFKQEDLYHENYGFTGLTTDEFNPDMLHRLQHKVYWYVSIRSLWRDPGKFFFKYVRRVLRPDMLKTLLRIARTVYAFFMQKTFQNHQQSLSGE